MGRVEYLSNAPFVFTGTKKEDFTEVKSSLLNCLIVCFVIRMGLEPMTPTLKVLCSTS